MDKDDFLGALTEFIPQIPNAQLFLDQIDTLDLTILERVHVQDLVVSEANGMPVIEFALAIEGQTRLDIPGISFISLFFGESIPGYTFVRAYLSIGPKGRLRLYDFRLALEIHQPLLKRYDLDTQTAGADDFRFEVDSAIGVDTHANVSIDFYDFDIPPFTVGETGLILALENCNLDLGGVRSPGELLDFIDDPEFNGIYAETALLYWLPQFNVPYAPFKGIRLQLENVALEQAGISFEFDLQWQVVHDGLVIARDSEFVGYLFEDRLGIAIESARGQVAQNIPREFAVNGIIQLPFLPSLLGIEFQLTGNPETSSFETSLILTTLAATPLVVELGSSANQLSIQHLVVEGRLQDDGFMLHGSAGFELHLPGFDLAVEQTELLLGHSSEGDRLHFGLRNVELGLLGTVEQATLKIDTTRTAEGNTEFKAFYIEVDLQWEDALDRLDLDPLPDFMPRPPDDATLKALLTWEGAQWRLRFSTELTGIDNLWPFIPPRFRPEIRRAEFVFDARQRNTNDTFIGEASLGISWRLPEVAPIGGGEILSVTTGDPDGWIEATARARIDQDATGGTESHLDFELLNAVAMTVQVPGLPQDEPPINIQITRIDVDIGSASATAGQLTVLGTFETRPLQPPVSLPLAAPVKKLLAPVTAAALGGSASAQLAFKDDDASLRLTCQFDEARINLDLFDMLAGLAGGIAAPEGLDGQPNSIDLDLEIGFDLRSIGLQLGTLTPETSSPMSFELQMALAVLGVHTDFEFKISDQQIAFGFTELAIPIKIPQLPLRLDDLNRLRGTDGAWDKQKWLTEIEPELAGQLAEIEAEISGYRSEILSLEQELAGLEGPQRTLKAAALKDLKTRKMPAANETALHLSAKRFLMDGILILHGLMSTPASRNQYQQFVQVYQGLVDSTIGAIHLDTRLLFVMSDIKFVLPFENPADIRVEGGAQITGFAADDPFAPLGDLIFKLGLSAEYIYFSVEGGGDPIPLPEFGRYTDGSIDLKHIRLAYGYAKNSLAVAFAGELRLPTALVEDADTSNSIGLGMRLPVQSRLAFTLDLIPIVLGEVDFLIPLVKFDLDLRQPDTPGLSDSRTCKPAWDGLQLIVPEVIRLGFKKVKFSPFFGPIPAPNVNVGYDIMLGDEDNGLTFVCDNYLVISPVAGQYPIPFIADATPFFDNLCLHLRLAGFGVNFNLQRPFPQPSPMAIFEIIGLLSDPAMPVDPNGALANTMRATIENAFISLPPYMVRMFPELGPVVQREVNYTLNLGTVITLAQNLTTWLQATLKWADESAVSLEAWVQEIIETPPELSPSAVLALLPPPLRCLHLEGAFGGFNASAVIALMTKAEAYAEFDRRDNPPIGGPRVTLLAETFADAAMPGWKIVNQGHRKPAWKVVDGELHQTSNTHLNTLALLPGTFVQTSTPIAADRVEISAVMRSDEGGIGVMFAIQDKNQYYRFAIFDARSHELIKVTGGKPDVLHAGRTDRPQSTRYAIVIQIEPARDVAAASPGIRPKDRRTRSTGKRISVYVNGKRWCDVIDAGKPLSEGTVGLYCWKNRTARFDHIHVYSPGKAPALEPGKSATTQAALGYRPALPPYEKPLHDPLDANNNLFTEEAFAAFTADDLDDVERPLSDAGGVIAAAQVNLFDQQLYRFLGFIFSDGNFRLVSQIGIEPLQLKVAGIPIQLPFTLHGRLKLSGQARGAATQAAVKAEGWCEWQALPLVLTLRAGRPDLPVSLELRSDGRFALKGSGQASFFDGSAQVTGQCDISETHCFLRGRFDYQPDYFIDGKRVLQLSLDTSGRVGPGDDFAFSGAGEMSILGNRAAAVEGTVSRNAISLKTVVGIPKWNGLPIDDMRMELEGAVKFNSAAHPDFQLVGAASLKGFKGRGRNKLQIDGVGGIKSQNGKLSTYIEGALHWQGRDWLRGRLELGTQGASIMGATSFALDLIDLPDHLNTQLASLYFAIDINGRFGLNRTGRLTECGLQTQWVLAIKLPGADSQLLPVAMQSIDINFENLGVGDQLVKLVELLTFDSLHVLPVEGISIPVPKVTPTSYARLYLSKITRGGGSQDIPMLKHRSSTHPNQLFRIPTAIKATSTTYPIDLGPIAEGLGIPDPSLTLPVPSLSNYRSFYIGSERVHFPTISVPSLSATPTPRAAKIFEVPTDFDFNFSSQTLTTLLDHLNCTISLGWKGLDLGIIVTKNNKNKFTPFRNMFGQP